MNHLPKIPTVPIPIAPYWIPVNPDRKLKDFLFLCIADGHEFAHSVSGFDQSDAEYTHQYNFPDHEVVRVMVT